MFSSEALAALPVPPYGFAYRKNAGYLAVRRGVDIVAGAAALVALSPLIGGAMLAVKLEDGGSIFFKQMRVGQYGRLFPMFKLRTMRNDLCADALKPASGRDPRITRIGRWLRRFSIDELPQLFNVLRGDMTLIGPRPEMPFLVRQFEPWQQLRHLSKPGVTGLWQVTCRSTISLHRPEATAIDVDYISRGSLAVDGAILLRTVGAVFSDRGAY